MTFKFISYPNLFEGYYILSPEIWGKTFADWLKEFFDGYIFSNPSIHRMGSQIFCVPDVKKCLNLSAILYLYCYCIGVKRNLLENQEPPFKQLWRPWYVVQLAFSESATPVALLLPGVNTPFCNHRFKNVIYNKTSPNSYLLSIYSSNLFSSS